MIQIIESRAIEATDHVHYIIEDYRLVKCPLLGDYPTYIYLSPFTIFHFIAEQVVKSLLTCVNTAKYENGFIHDDS